MARTQVASQAPLDRLPLRGDYVFSNPIATLRDRLALPALLVPLATAVALLTAGAYTRSIVLVAAGSVTSVLWAAAGVLFAGHGLVTDLRFAWCRRISRQLGLRSLILVPVHPRLTARLYGSPLPLSAKATVEVHVDPTVRWWLRDDPADLRTTRAATRFKDQLRLDYAWILDGLLPASPGWAFSVSTWHKLPDWLPSLMDRAATSSMAIIRPGPVPTWLPRLGERHRRRAQRRMFGGLLGRPVDDPARWTSYFLAPLCQGYSGDILLATASDRQDEELGGDVL